MRRLLIFSVLILSIFQFSCRGQPITDSNAANKSINFRSYYFPFITSPDGAVYCYKDQTGEIKKYKLIRDSLIHHNVKVTDTALIITDYDSAFVPISRRVELFGINKLLPIGTYIYIDGQCFQATIDTYYQPWIQPIQTDSISAFSICTFSLATQNLKLKENFHYERLLYDLGAYKRADCIKEVDSATAEVSLKSDSNKTKHVRIRIDDIYAEGVGLVASYETIEKTRKEYYLGEILSLKVFYKNRIKYLHGKK